MFYFLMLMFGLMFLIGAIVLLLNGFMWISNRRSVKKGFPEFLKDRGITNYESEFTADNKYIVHDRGHRMIWVYDGGDRGSYYHNMTGVKLSIDDSVAYQSSVGSAVGRAVVGGMLAGGVGAIIGGVTGNKTGKKMAHKIDLVISYNNPSDPYRKISFLNSKEGVDVFSDDYKKAEASGLYWSNLITACIKNG